MKKSINDTLKLVKKMCHQGAHLEQVENEERKRSIYSHSHNASPITSPKSHHSPKHHHHKTEYEPEPKMTIQIEENPPIPKRRHTHHTRTRTNEHNNRFINTGIQTNASSIQASTPVPKSKLRRRLNNDSIEVAVRDLLQTQPPKTLPHRHHVSSAFRNTDSQTVNYLNPSRRSYQQTEETYERRNELHNDRSHRDQDVQATPKTHTQKIYNVSSKTSRNKFNNSIYSPMGVYQNNRDDIKNFVVFDIEPSPSNSPLNSPQSQNTYKKQSPSPIEIPDDNKGKLMSNTYTKINHRVNSTEILSENSYGEFNVNKSETTSSTYTKFSQNSSQNNLKSQNKEEGLPKLNKPRPTNVIDLYQDTTDTNDSFGKELDQIEKQEIQLAKDEMQKEKKDEEEFNNLLEDAEETIKSEQKEQDKKMKQQIEQQVYIEFEEDDDESEKERDKVVIQKIQTTIETVTKTETSQKHLLNIKKLEDEEESKKNQAADLLSVSDSQNEEEENDENKNDQFLKENDENEIENDFLDEQNGEENQDNQLLVQEEEDDEEENLQITLNHEEEEEENKAKEQVDDDQTFSDFDKLVTKDEEKQTQPNENAQPSWVLDEDKNEDGPKEADFISADLIKNENDETNGDAKMDQNEISIEDSKKETNESINQFGEEENYQIEIDAEFDEKEEEGNEASNSIQNQSNSNNSIQVEGDEITEISNQDHFEFDEEEEKEKQQQSNVENGDGNLFQLDFEEEEDEAEVAQNQFEADSNQANQADEESSKNQFEADFNEDEEQQQEEKGKLEAGASSQASTGALGNAKNEEEDKNQPDWVVDNENEVKQDEIDDIFNDFEPDSKDENENQPVTLDEVDESQNQPVTLDEVDENRNQPVTLDEVDESQNQPVTLDEVDENRNQPVTLDEVDENQNQPVTLDEVDENQNQPVTLDEVDESHFVEDQNEFDENGQIVLGEEEDEEEEAEMIEFNNQDLNDDNEFDDDKMGEESLTQQTSVEQSLTKKIESSSNQIHSEKIVNGHEFEEDEEEDDEGAVMQIMIDDDEEDGEDDADAGTSIKIDSNINESDGQALIKDDSEPFKKYYDSLSGSDKPPNNYFETFSPDSLNQSGNKIEGDLNTEN